MLLTDPKTVLFIFKEIKDKLNLSIVMDLTVVPAAVVGTPAPGYPQ